MPLSEFELIDRCFSDLGATRKDVTLGVGDDCALLRVPPGQELAVTVDTLVEGVHFLPDVDPESLGHKVLAVNLSDLAAMGATPAWITLALTLPAPDLEWTRAFARGLGSLAERHLVRLVGGDTTRGPRSITLQAHGFVPEGMALRRDGARPGDLVFVTGTLGDAGLGLRCLTRGYDAGADRDYLVGRLERPEPRVDAGRVLAGVASGAIDISDGLLSDLGHVVKASGVGAEIHLDRLPLSGGVQHCVDETGDWNLPLASGDDYELCLVIPPERAEQARALARSSGVGISGIGRIVPGSGIVVLDARGEPLATDDRGFDHFRE